MASPYYVSTPTTDATTEVSRFEYSCPAPQCQLLYPQHTGAFQTSGPASFFLVGIGPTTFLLNRVAERKLFE
jgi:hypothetical protein